MDNKTAGIGDPYWFEWSVGLLYMVKMLNPESGIKNVVLQSEDSQCLDDVVITYENEMIEYIQVKHTREKDKLSFSDLIEGEAQNSYLHKLSKEWKEKEEKKSGKNKVILFTNREMGNRSYTPNGGGKRPPLRTFWKMIKDQVALLDTDDENIDINSIIVDKEWENAWQKFKECIQILDTKGQLLFLQNFELKTDQSDLEEMIDSIANELEKAFNTTHEKAVNLHQKLCYRVMWWATSIKSKKEIEKEDVMDALSLQGDSIKGEHFFPFCAPFFQSRIKFCEDIENIILNGRYNAMFLTGAPGCGKTNIISYLACKPDSIITLRFHAFKPILPGDLYVSADPGISDPVDFWGSLLVMLRKRFKGRLYEYRVPISIELIDSIDILRSEVLRLASAWANITGKKTVIAIDGIDHAARSGGINNFLKTLPAPETLPQNVRFIIAGQPTYHFAEYPDFLSDVDSVLEVNVPNIEECDLELLYEQCLPKMKYSKHDKALIVDFIANIAKGNTLSGVFAMQEATKYSKFIEFEQNSNVKKLNAGIQSYYEYIWRGAVQKTEKIGFTIDMYLAAIFSVINRKVTAKNFADIFDCGMQVWQWEEILQNLFPIVLYDESGYGVFHNDVRIFLTNHYRRAKQLNSSICEKIANFLMTNDFDAKIKHEIIFKLLKEAKQEEKYIDVFTCQYVLEAYLLKRELREIQQQMEETLEILPKIQDKKSIVVFSCAVTTMQQYEESLRWTEKKYQSEIDIPFALDSEKNPANNEIISLDDYFNLFIDVEILFQKKELIRAKRIIERWFDKKLPGKLFENVKNDDKNETIRYILETWGKYARKFEIAPTRVDYVEETERIGSAYFYRGWLKESAMYEGTDQLMYTLENTGSCYKMDLDSFLQATIQRGNKHEMEFILNDKIKGMFSVRNKILACAWSINCHEIGLCKDWLYEIKSRGFEYIQEKDYGIYHLETEKRRVKFTTIGDLLYVLSYISEENVDVLIDQAMKKSGFLNSSREDVTVASNLLLAVTHIAYIDQCIICDSTNKINPKDFDALLEIIIENKYYYKCYAIDTITYRRKLLTYVIQVTNSLPVVFQYALEKKLCEKAESFSEVALFEVYWKFLLSKGKEKLIEKYFDSWMGINGKIWMEELSERDYISNILLRVANEMDWIEKVKEAKKLINLRCISYVGRKEYSLLNPLNWFMRTACNKSEIWSGIGIRLMNISQYAQRVGDNRAFVEIIGAVSSAAAKEGLDDFFCFVQIIKRVESDWKEVLFDGIIAALENAFFYEDELLQLWKKAVCYFPIDEHAYTYDHINMKHKIYCADVHQAISLCIIRHGYDGLEEKMESMAPKEYKQRRLERSEHSFYIPERWFESEFHESMNSFIDAMTEIDDIKERFDYIKMKYKQNDINWDYLTFFIEISQKQNPKIINDYKQEIVKIIKNRELNPWHYDGINRLFNIFFPYLSEDEITDFLNSIICTYHYCKDEGWVSASYSLANDLENFCFALFSRYGDEDNVWALQKILDMHSTWLNGAESIEQEFQYQLNIEKHIDSWNEFWLMIEKT